MRFLTPIIVLFFAVISGFSQTTIDFTEPNDSKLYIKFYGHIDYNQSFEEGTKTPGVLDAHRMVTLFGYQFSRKTQFVSEIEFEHAKEIFVEQAFVKHQMARNINLKAGLIIIPMGMVNEQHEPTFFYTVERPLIDKNIIPSTWREIGLGITGLIPNHSLKYQLYLVNNPISYSEGEGKINGEKGIRSGRQKAAKSIITSFPALSGQLEYFGFGGSKVGLSFYHGKTNTDIIDHPDPSVIDSSEVRLTMAALHTTYDMNNWTLRFQYVINKFSNEESYNAFTDGDVPDLMHGYYALVAYNLLDHDTKSLSPFIRYSQMNNHLKVSEGMTKDLGLQRNVFTLGVNYKPNPGVVFKLDYQFHNLANDRKIQQINSGVGVWF